MLDPSHPDSEDHCELFGDMFDQDIQLVRETHKFGEREFFVMATHIYYGKTSKFMPLTVWPSCPGFLHAFVELSKAGQRQAETTALNPVGLQVLSGLFEDSSRKLRVLELGAGTGLFAIVAKALFPDLIIEIVSTDCRSSSLALIKENVELNPGVSVTVENLFWKEESSSLPDLGKFDLIVGTDVVFAPEAIGPLLFTIKHYGKPGAVGLIANHIVRVDNLEDKLFENAKRLELEFRAGGFCDLEQKIKLHIASL